MTYSVSKQIELCSIGIFCILKKYAMIQWTEIGKHFCYCRGLISSVLFFCAKFVVHTTVLVAATGIKAIFLYIFYFYLCAAYKTRLIIKTGFVSNNWINSIHLARLPGAHCIGSKKWKLCGIAKRKTTANCVKWYFKQDIGKEMCSSSIELKWTPSYSRYITSWEWFCVLRRYLCARPI